MADVTRSLHRHPVTRQQKNLLLAEPIARLSPERFRGLAIDPALVDALDLKYLALVAIDFVMERSAVDGGATDEEIVAFLASEAHLMQPALNQEECRRIGRVIVDQLVNARDSHRALSERYFSRDEANQRSKHTALMFATIAHQTYSNPVERKRDFRDSIASTRKT
ncbi:MAG: hypothetical protein OXE86_20760 [Alphaproteobacteria bacterium]|nr:hypothetical protein [Alphaproteobacteria bacterium]